MTNTTEETNGSVWPIVATVEQEGAMFRWYYSAMSEFLTEHPSGNLKEEAAERFRQSDAQKMRFEFTESGRISSTVVK